VAKKNAKGMRKSNSENSMNPAVCKKLFQELTHSEVAYLLNGESHAVFLSRRRHRYHGQCRKQLERVIALGPNASRFVDLFIKEFEED